MLIVSIFLWPFHRGRQIYHISVAITSDESAQYPPASLIDTKYRSVCDGGSNERRGDTSAVNMLAVNFVSNEIHSSSSGREERMLSFCVPRAQNCL